jgi:hypothetical protein
MWRDNDLIFDQNLRTLGSSTGVARDVYLFTYWNGIIPQDQNCFVDDVIITSDRNNTQTELSTGYPWVGIE